MVNELTDEELELFLNGDQFFSHDWRWDCDKKLAVLQIDEVMLNVEIKDDFFYMTAKFFETEQTKVIREFLPRDEMITKTMYFTENHLASEAFLSSF